GRGAVVFPNSTLLERFVFSKPIFDPSGLFVAHEEGRCVGFAHAAMSQACSVQSELEPVGVICLIGVRPSHQRQGIGSELLRRSEEYLRKQGAKTLRGGPHWPHNPFYLGLYGGCDSPGFLASDIRAEPFFTRHSYRPVSKILVMQRVLDHTIKII